MNKLLYKNTRVLLAVVLTMFLVVNTKVTAQTKNTIEYKTSIIDQNQKPMPDGSYNFRFSIYNVATGGSALWSEDRFGVQVRRAAISVDLGSANPFPQNLFKNTSLYLQVCMDANLAGGDGFGECAGSFEENFKPRKVITGVPWAFNATSLGPVNVNTGETAYNLDTFGSDSTLLNLNFNDNSKFSVNSTGTIKLTPDSDIFFGDNISLKNAGASDTAGASLIGVYTGGFVNLSGSSVQSIFENLDPLLKWKANGTSVFYNGGNVGIGTNVPGFALDVVGTGNFSNGIIVGGNTNAIAGGIRFNGGNFEGFNGTVWAPLGGGSSATTDNGAGLTYVTNTTNSFAIGGATSAAPFLFDPISGALIKRNTTIRNDPAATIPNLLTLDSSGANAQVGGNKNGITGTLAYTPSGGTGTQIYNAQEFSTIVNGGDGSNIDRVRAIRSTVTNNSTGNLNGGLFNLSAITTNNGNIGDQYGIVSTTINNGTLSGQLTGSASNVTNNGDSGVFTIGTSANAVNTVGAVTDQLTASYFQTTNNGTSDYQYGSRNVVNNNGTINITLYGGLNGVENDGVAPVMYGFQNSATNHFAGTVNSDSFGIYNTSVNEGTVNASLYGIYNTIANSGFVAGDRIGLFSGDGVTTTRLNYNGTYAVDTTGPIKSNTQVIVGNSSGTDEAGAIRFTGAAFEGYDGFGWNSLGGGSPSPWVNDGFGNYYYNAGNIGVGGIPSGSYTFEVQGTTYMTGSLGVGTTPGGIYILEISGSTLLNDTTVNGAVAIGTGGDPGGVYQLEVTGETKFNNRMGIGTDTNGLYILNILGDVHVDGSQYITNGALCVDGGTGCPALSPGGIYGDLAYAEFDVAENILANSDVEAGDIVSGLNGQQEVVRKTEIANESTLLGVVSTNPGSLGGVHLKPRDGFIVVPFVLSGRVPVKVSTENGAINVGDPITSSSIPGVGMKATGSKVKILGYAMQAYDASGVSKIIVVFQPGYLP